MEKRLLAVLFVIGMIVYAIILIIPLVLVCAILVGIIYLLIRLYKQQPEAYGTWGARLIMPLLIIGWIYVGYLCYTNLYYNTYYVEPCRSGALSTPYYKITAKDDREAIIKAWIEYIRRNKDSIDIAFYNHLDAGKKVLLYNHTNDEIIQLYRYEDLNKSLTYKNGEDSFYLWDFFCN